MPPHARSPEDVSLELDSDPERGLSAGAAATRLVTAGPNRLPAPERPAYVAIALRQLADPLVALLLGAAVVSAAIGEQLEAAAIAAIVVLNAVLGFVQEAGAERAVLALRSTVQRTAAVVRDGREIRVPVEDVVPGDLVVLREGDRVPADARLVAAERLELDESALTGESLPVTKDPKAVAAGTPLAERTSMTFAGAAVTRGRGRALVVATGADSEVGQVASLTAAAKPPPTPLQRRLGRLSGAMVGIGIAITLLLGAGMLARDASFEEAFLVGVAVAVAAVPEGLAATVTITLAQGAASHGRERCDRPPARRGRDDRRRDRHRGGQDRHAHRQSAPRRRRAAVPGTGRDEVLETGLLASTAELLEDDTGLHVAGDPVDGAFLLAAAATGAGDPRSAGERTLVLEVPFDPWRKRQTSVYRELGRLRVVVKGAPETLLERSRLGTEERRRLSDEAIEWAEQGLRVLAVGERWLDGLPSDEDELDLDVDLLGLVGLRDPLRPTAADSVRRARDAGIDVMVLTGDHPVTAAAIARALQLGDHEPLTGAAISEMDDDTLREATREHAVFARVTPADKLRLVEVLQASGHVVAVTGDGINDTPALRRADVGVAMGLSGTEAAREAAEIVLTNDDFSTIVRAVHEGRRIDENVRKFVAFLLSANLGEVILFGIAVLAGLGVPMTVVQVLAVNLLTDGLPAVALSRDPASPGVMRRGPRGLGALFSRRLGSRSRSQEAPSGSRRPAPMSSAASSRPTRRRPWRSRPSRSPSCASSSRCARPTTPLGAGRATQRWRGAWSPRRPSSRSSCTCLSCTSRSARTRSMPPSSWSSSSSLCSPPSSSRRRRPSAACTGTREIRRTLPSVPGWRTRGHA